MKTIIIIVFRSFATFLTNYKFYFCGILDLRYILDRNLTNYVFVHLIYEPARNFRHPVIPHGPMNVFRLNTPRPPFACRKFYHTPKPHAPRNPRVPKSREPKTRPRRNPQKELLARRIIHMKPSRLEQQPHPPGEIRRKLNTPQDTTLQPSLSWWITIQRRRSVSGGRQSERNAIPWPRYVIDDWPQTVRRLPPPPTQIALGKMSLIERFVFPASSVQRGCERKRVFRTTPWGRRDAIFRTILKSMESD